MDGISSTTTINVGAKPREVDLENVEQREIHHDESLPMGERSSSAVAKGWRQRKERSCRYRISTRCREVALQMMVMTSDAAVRVPTAAATPASAPLWVNHIIPSTPPLPNCLRLGTPTRSTTILYVPQRGQYSGDATVTAAAVTKT